MGARLTLTLASPLALVRRGMGVTYAAALVAVVTVRARLLTSAESLP